ncbi:hypothetical protein PI87_19260 [Ralstonia sp. A12]|uniref:hypothetical protein n=1 Tax=Ralstonia sp. A12 TaxID=1217052 RepID=UPI000575B0FE|nr:hypothetical protein [Ralstonia sp. A12]KHK52913.1 hypothetical protein PI87_19260 [Ralstonia sp. A12]
MIVLGIAALLMLLGGVLLLVTHGAQRHGSKGGKPMTSNTASKRHVARGVAYTLLVLGGLIVLGVIALAFLLVGPFF